MHIHPSLSPYILQRLKRMQAQLDQLQAEAEPYASIAPSSLQPHGDIIVFPGSFNPPTTAHLALLKQARRYAFHQQGLHRSRPILLYAAMSTHIIDKETVERPLLLDRVILLSTVLRHHIPGTGVLLINRGLYVEQAKAIRASFTEVRRILFLMGFDKIEQILDPRYYEDRDAALAELFKLADLLVAPRGEAGMDELKALLQRRENQPFAHAIHSLPFNGAYRSISSSQARQGSEQALRSVPREVRDFMQKTRAYAPPVRQSDGTEIDAYAERVKHLQHLLDSGT